ncbi:MAG: hypothetical protein CMH27_01525 [Micavibrio sp.]|nr:hypothetical protein [Micavibrio sp.]|tara:strand:+ start:942 stop:1199 length:258 start_codon:yes stop_codon:yes gene_type:complete
MQSPFKELDDIVNTMALYGVGVGLSACFAAYVVQEIKHSDDTEFKAAPISAEQRNVEIETKDLSRIDVDEGYHSDVPAILEYTLD